MPRAVWWAVAVVVWSFVAAVAYCGAAALDRALSPCSTDTDCMMRHGGDGGPE